jgi:large subunit ribosomal protein L6e
MTPKAKKAPRTTPINAEVRQTGVTRLSRGRMFHKRGLWLVEKWKKQNQRKPEDRKPKRPTRMVEKKVNGEKNGSTRKVRTVRFPRFYPTEDAPRKLRTNKKAFSQHKHSLRPSITPGTVLILVAGRHAGKRVVFLKQLASGLLLVSGPYKLNGCPLRRVNQRYVIATSTRLDVSKVQVPQNVNDAFFNRVRARPQKPAEGEIFQQKKEEYKVNDDRKKAQVEVDRQLVAAIKANSERRLLAQYLKSRFSLSNKQYPHQLKF